MNISGEEKCIQRKSYETEELCDGQIFTGYNGYSQGVWGTPHDNM